MTRMKSLRLASLAYALWALFAIAAVEAGGAGFANYLELRIYPVVEGRQSRFLEYFEEHFLESQEVTGMRIWGQFRDLETPTQFIWLRGYESMEQRLSGLQQFYTSSVWHETGGVAVSMLAGRAEHVHFLEPVSPEDGFSAGYGRPILVSEIPESASPGIVVAEVFLIDEDPETLVESVRSSVIASVERAGGSTLGLFRSSEEPNNFPILSFIEDEEVLVLFSSFESLQQYQAATRSPPDQPTRLETFVMEPGRRSRLRHASSD